MKLSLRSLGALIGIVFALHRPSDAAPLQAGDGNSPGGALAALDRKVSDLDAEEQTARKELGRLETDLADTHKRVVRRGRAFVRLTRAGLLPVGTGFDGLVQHAMQVELMQRAVLHDIEAEQKIRSRAATIAIQLEKTSKERGILAAQRSATDAARLAMDDEADRQVAFDRAFESSTGSGDYVAVYGSQNDKPSSGHDAGFASMKGRLLFPVVGRAEVRPGRREGADGPGLEVRAPTGSVVRTVFAGRVAFADRYGPYGRIVIVDHGDHYYTVSGNLGSTDAHVGQELTSGDRIGTVGDDGQGPMLYFEVRHRSRTVPPGPWLGLLQ